jgi:sugar phosphate isomerase/epimerase
MKLGLFAVLFQALSLDELLKELKKYPALTAIELGTGNYPGACHLDVDALLASTKRAQEFSAQIADAGLSISAF